MTRREAIKFVLVRSLGNFLLLFAIYGVIATFGPVISVELKFRIAQARGIKFEVSKVSEVSRVSKASDVGFAKYNSAPGFADVLAGNKQQVLIANDTQFSILIPKIGASAKVYPNVDPGNSQEFLEVLKHGVAHAKGSVFPGMDGNVYLFAHSADNWWNVTRYNAVFYLLKDLSEGDEIVVFFDDKRFNYSVSQKVISDPKDISFLTQSQMGKEQLVLQTCWPPGTTWKRLYILAEPK